MNSFQISSEKEYRNYQIAKAILLLKKFKWTETQKSYLNTIVEKGYLIDTLNNVAGAFGKQKAIDGDKKCVLFILGDVSKKSSIYFGTV